MTKLAEGVRMIGEIVRRQLVGDQHLGGRIAGREQILQQIRRVVPTAGGIEKSPVGQRPVSASPIKRMANRIQPGVVPAALLAHELQQLRAERRVNIRANRKRQ